MVEGSAGGTDNKPGVRPYHPYLTLQTRGADPNLRHECTAVLDAATAAGLTVIRTWAFCDGPQWNALQPSPGVLDERVFRSLDWLLAEAAARGLRLLLVFTNYWRDYGGMAQYVAWARQQRGEQVGRVAWRSARSPPSAAACWLPLAATACHCWSDLAGYPFRD